MEAFLRGLDDCLNASKEEWLDGFYGDEILRDVCKGFNYEGIEEDAEISEWLRKSLKLPNLDGDGGFEGHGGNVEEEEKNSEEVEMELDQAFKQVFGEEAEEKNSEEEVERLVDEAFKEVFGEEEEEEVVHAHKKPARSEDELRAKMERTKAKLRDGYRKTSPTRHSKVLEINQIPELKKPLKKKKKEEEPSAVAVRAPKRSLQQEARAICKRAKTATWKRSIKIV